MKSGRDIYVVDRTGQIHTLHAPEQEERTILDLAIEFPGCCLYLQIDAALECAQRRWRHVS